MTSNAADHLSPGQLADLSALADDSLDPARRQEVHSWIESSPELLRLYERERAAVRVLRQAAEERAPTRLHRRVEAQRVKRLRAPLRVGYVALAGAVAAVAVALVLALAGGAPGSPSVSQAAALALRGPSASAPPPDPGDPHGQLGDGFQQVYFPNWSTTLSWQATGMRRDHLDGRATMTVYYQRGSSAVAYTIVGSPALASPPGRPARAGGFQLRVLSVSGRTVVTWRRAGHTCVISAAGVPVTVLEQLVGWRARVTD